MNISDWSDQDKEKTGSYLQWNSYRSERYRLFYVATPKVACTTLKWWFAQIEGRVQALLANSASAETDPELIIHDAFHKVAPDLTGLPLDNLVEAILSDKYFRFAVVRNPFKRIFSAWQSKLLLREPLQVGPYVGMDFYHHPISAASDVAKAFEGFLEQLAENEAPSYWDHHWTPQVDLLRPDLISYSCLAKIEESEKLIQGLREWIGEYQPIPFKGRRSNESLIPYVPEFITRRSADLIRALYANDFDLFGYDKQLPSIKDTFSAEQCAIAIKAIKVIRARHQRLGERNEQIADLSQAVTARDERIAGLSLAVIGRDEQIAGLSRAVTERDEQIVGLSQAATERDAQIVGLRQAVTERDRQIADLSLAVTEREGQHAYVSQVVTERDRQIAYLSNVITERDGQIGDLNDAVAKLNGEINFQNSKVQALLLSRSWRWTNTLRLISSRVSAVAKPLRASVSRSTARIPMIRQITINRIRRSPLFDSAFYLEQSPDVCAVGVDAATHYCLSGWKEHRDPSAQFSTRYYLEIHPDVAAAGINPLLHYIEHGQAEGRLIQRAEIDSGQPSENGGLGASVDVALVASSQGDAHGDVEDSEAVPNVGESVHDRERIDSEVEAIRKSGLFDAAYYLAMYPDIWPIPSDPLRHYCEIGWREGRNPSDDFETNGYLEAYLDIKNGALNPFWHYVVAGRSESRQTTFDSNSRYEDDVYFGQPISDIQLIAYYASTNWSAVQQARNAFHSGGQLMPHGDLGFYVASKAITIAKQAQMARNHGVSAWCFTLDAAQGPTSGDPLIEFLSNLDMRMGFVIDVDLRFSPVDEQRTSFLENALADERYLRINGRPVLVMTLPDDDHLCDEVLTAFDTLLNRATNPYRIVRRDGLVGQATGFAIRHKIEAILDFPVAPIPGETGSFLPIHKSGIDSVPYSLVVSQAIARMRMNDDEIVPCYRTVTLGRDDSALNPSVPLRYTRNYQKEYRRWLDAAISDARAKHAPGNRLLFVNAWNDWNRGAILEPDRLAGYSKLNETSRALLDLPLGLAMPKVSVIVPNYNHGAYLQRRLNSIYRQTYRNIEVLLLDDCSTDKSREILEEYANYYPDITMTLFNQKNSGGVFHQWAKGIKAATGNLIWIAESDDYCDENFLEKLVRCFDDEAVMLAYSRVEFVRSDESIMPDEFGRYVRDLDCREQWKHSYVKTAHKEVSDALGIINTIPNASGAIFRRPMDMPLLDDKTWLSMRVVGDWIFYLHLLRGGKIAYSAETTNYFRRYEDSTAAKTYKKDVFYLELGMAARVVTRLYDVPKSAIEHAFKRSKELFDHFCASSDDDFKRWYDMEAVLKELELRTPNVIVSTMGFLPGGAEILPLRIANELKKMGYSVLLLSAGLNKSEDGVRRLLRADIPVIETSDIVLTKQLIRDFGIEVLNSHQWHIQKYPTHVSDVFSGLRAHVATLHGMIEYGDAFGVTSDQLLIANKNVTTWVYTADKNLGPFIEYGLYEKKPSRFIKMPNGMEPPKIKPIVRSEIGVPNDAFVLCCVSRAIPDKGWAETIEAVALARKNTGKDIRLILVGNGPVYDDYCRIGVPPFVYLAGFSENSVGFYAAADMGIMLTKFKSESFPLTIVDCLFAGRPYIATAVGEVRNMLTTDCGLAGEIIDLENWEIPIDQAVKGISKFATNAEALRSSKAVVAEAANRYRIDVVVKQYASIFERDIHALDNNAPVVH